ncbi:hypothetical protein SAMN05216326_1333 [Nitrosomonas marina]|uniref:TIR domain-containing protein n=1 Tax=Nitrosomonas marina TaxID=917 RepID=A0A1I0F2S2_9PROT|nr:hypothetical protein [Nitrosomonas marina]SET52325.1 hypothetical protein SAMN05216326_1333 [Nitrosomonas marina]
MPLTFGDQLKLFALSVDVVDIDRFNRINRLIDEYCRETLGIESTKLHLASEVDNQPALKQYGMGALDIEHVRTIKTSNGNYNSLTSLAYGKRKPLWIVSANGKQNLKKCSSGFSDLWSGLKTLPDYKTNGSIDEKELRTSIIIPICHKNDMLGVMNFETSDYIEITDEAKSELSKITETLGILIHLFRSADAQKTSTTAALDNLQQLLSRPLPKLTKPKIFLASSADAEADVISAVCNVLDESTYTEKLDLIYWKDMNQPGNINQQLLEAIASCRYGICYFSQKVADNDYIDNINVVFEAGMFHGRVDEITPEPASWIPIREKQSPELPFDFAQERILWVERNKNGTLKTKPFVNTFRKKLDILIRNN